MKEAMWGLGLIMLCLFTFVIIGVVSNITLTNQQDYYGVKQTTEAGAWDSVDQVVYKRGICVCTNKTAEPGGAVKFTNKTQYTISEPNDDNECEDKDHCDLRLGEYVLDPHVFVESVISRLGSIIKPTEVYDIKIQEVIPYPPKVSVYISYHQALNVDDDDKIDEEIPNQFDGIFEDTGPQSVLTYANNDIPDWTLSCSTPETPTETTQETPETPTETTPETPTQQRTNCKWHYDSSSNITCRSVSPTGKDSHGAATYATKKVSISGRGSFSSCGQAYNSCVSAAKSKCGSGYTYSSGCSGKQTYNITYKDNTTGTKTRICYNNSTPAGVCDMTKMKRCVCNN